MAVPRLSASLWVARKLLHLPKDWLCSQRSWQLSVPFTRPSLLSNKFRMVASCTQQVAALLKSGAEP
ncbi:hypothetical protein CDL15_Pgr016332 [Punica granatum]|uniref:Uncharacterized protein n=1 Tax=Punica granatum TaxID=22663 RepID=A0A218W7Q5_PUNGR|nr:hypothetical protein CDL15_Pgr016332 [Punica granatum]